MILTTLPPLSKHLPINLTTFLQSAEDPWTKYTLVEGGDAHATLAYQTRRRLKDRLGVVTIAEEGFRRSSASGAWIPA